MIEKFSTRDDLLDACVITTRNVRKERKTGLHLWNVPCAFDIETTSTMDENGNEFATMWVWQFSANGVAVYGRTWEEWLQLLHDMKERIGDVVPVIWIHNAAFEFQFFRKMFEWKDVFAKSGRNVLRAQTVDGIIFRDSLALTGKKLEEVAVDVGMKKMKGDLDYRLSRHSKTPITEKELGYMLADVAILDELIRRKITEEGSVAKIPLTKTGYVRRDIKKATIQNRDPKIRGRYRRLIRALEMTPDEFRTALAAMQGGFTHTNPYQMGKTITHVGSFDLASSYPAVIATEYYPNSHGIFKRALTLEQYDRDVRDGYLFVGKFFFRNLNIRKKCWFAPVQHAKSAIRGQAHIDNGRVVFADELITTMTNADFQIVRACYTWDEIIIFDQYAYTKAPLPRPFVDRMLDYYEGKTTLKDVPGKEEDYRRSKELLNSFFRHVRNKSCAGRGRLRSGNAYVGSGSEKSGQRSRKNEHVFFTFFVVLVGRLHYRIRATAAFCGSPIVRKIRKRARRDLFGHGFGQMQTIRTLSSAF